MAVRTPGRAARCCASAPGSVQADRARHGYMFQTVYTDAQRVTQQLLGEGSYADLDGALSFGEFNNAFQPNSGSER